MYSLVQSVVIAETLLGRALQPTGLPQKEDRPSKRTATL